ncbi:hypothetical protein EVAR_55335_1 [Eumeta japonica]|uniref:Uncharacterized protein n=1 Tax=Eumeta variegata TaxID=151549 RepID=A0A4C1ZUQ3_EUMVA|nr:hypothetical protein EVAR_55335_1 [Eumeta japonica]
MLSVLEQRSWARLVSAALSSSSRPADPFTAYWSCVMHFAVREYMGLRRNRRPRREHKGFVRRALQPNGAAQQSGVGEYLAIARDSSVSDYLVTHREARTGARRPAALLTRRRDLLSRFRRQTEFYCCLREDEIPFGIGRQWLATLGTYCQGASNALTDGRGGRECRNTNNYESYLLEYWTGAHFGSMSSESCVQVLKEKLSEFDLSLDKDIVGITTDGASVMKKTVQSNPEEEFEDPELNTNRSAEEKEVLGDNPDNYDEDLSLRAIAAQNYTSLQEELEETLRASKTESPFKPVSTSLDRCKEPDSFKRINQGRRNKTAAAMFSAGNNLTSSSSGIVFLPYWVSVHRRTLRSPLFLPFALTHFGLLLTNLVVINMMATYGSDGWTCHVD